MKIAEEIYTVSRLTRAIRNLIEDGLPALWVEGELTNYTLHRSGHRYFTLRDPTSQVACVMWRTRQQPGFSLLEGQLIRAFGRVTVYEQGGKYQLDVQSLLPAGMGALQEALEALKRKLAAEGLFDVARKRSLPAFPRAIGIATSPTGAAIHDLAWGFSSRFPPADLFLIPVSVQGTGAAEGIARAIETFNRLALVDVIVIGRGGGSLEDLWAFNEEVLVRAVANSRIPVVSAVGHEVDVTLCDLAADLRAPTPTAAAALMVPDAGELKKLLELRRAALENALSRTVSIWRNSVAGIAKSYGLNLIFQRIAGERQRLDRLEETTGTAIRGIIGDLNLRTAALRGQISALSPQKVLERGYSIVRSKSGELIRDSDQIKLTDYLSLHFHRGSATVTVTEVGADVR